MLPIVTASALRMGFSIDTLVEGRAAMNSRIHNYPRRYSIFFGIAVEAIVNDNGFIVSRAMPGRHACVSMT